MADNFNDVAVGDEIIISGLKYDEVVSVSKIRFKTKRGYTFYKEDGMEYTSGYYRAQAHKPTEELRKKVEYKNERDRILSRIKNVRWLSYDNETLKRIIDILDEADAKSAETKNENNK